MKYLNIFATTLFRKDAESLNATSLAVIAGTENAFSFWILVQLSFAKVRVAEAFFSYSWSTSGFSNCFYNQDAFIFASGRHAFSVCKGLSCYLAFFGKPVSNQAFAPCIVAWLIFFKIGRIWNQMTVKKNKFMGEWIWSQSICVIRWLCGETNSGAKEFGLSPFHVRRSCLCHTVLVALPPVLWPVFMPVIK